LPSGKQLEDFIHYKKLSFAEGSAVKYLWRAGKKDGESKEKDLKKAEHYLKFLDKTDPQIIWGRVLHNLIEEAKEFPYGNQN
jgi:hypothetical protein